MNIMYLSHSYIPSRKANSVQVMRMCEALAKRGHNVTVISKDNALRLEPNVADDHAFYGVESVFEIVKLRRPNVRGGDLVFAWNIAKLLWLQRNRVDLVYSRNLVGAWLAVRIGLPLIFEVHDFIAKDRITRQLHRQIYGSSHLLRMVFNSEGLLNHYRSNFGTPGHDRIKVVRNASAVIAREQPKSISGPKAKNIMEANRTQIGYVGHLYPGRGIELILQLATLMPEIDFHIIGGTEDALRSWSQLASSGNVILHGFVEPSELRSYYEYLDILLMPYQKKVMLESSGTDTSGWMCPLKMFEYMSTGKPIVSSDLPVLREVLVDNETALLVSPEDVMEWKNAICRLANDVDFARSLGRSAQEDLMDNYTWEARVRNVLAGLW